MVKRKSGLLMVLRGRFSLVLAVAVLIAFCMPSAVLADEEILERGSKGDDVQELQTLLMELGYYDYEEITGYFGKITEDAVKSFQSDSGLKADGVVGDKTWALLKSAVEEAASLDEETTDAGTDSDAETEDTESTETSEDTETEDSESLETDTEDSEEAEEEVYTTLSEGMEGSQVEEVQLRLQELGLYEYSRTTGYYGLVTVDAVMAFQKAYGLDEDGVVGPETMEKLFANYSETSLIPGMVSDDVVELQERLIELGYYSYDADGEYGAKTREAVIYFQSAHGLSADGIAGTQTKQLLYSSAAMTEQEARRSLAAAEEEEAEEEQSQEETTVEDTSDNDTEQTESTESEETDDSSSEETTEEETTSSSSSTVEQAIALAKSKLGCPYVYGEEGPDEFDCSGFTYYIMKQFGVSLPRTAYYQGYNQYGVKITDPDNLQPGDLVFFNTNNSDGDLSDHVGIYLGNGDFIHASSGTAKCVVISNLYTSSYYEAAFSWGRRVLD